MIISAKDFKGPVRQSEKQYEGFLRYSEATRTFESTLSSVNKLIDDDAKKNNHTIIVYPNFFIIDGYTYNVSPQLFAQKIKLPA